MLAKGVKRKRSEDEADPPTATPSSSLFSLSVAKLHHSLQRMDPNLRHLVLVANMLRRLQGETQLASDPISPVALSEAEPPAVEAGVPASSPSDTCKSPLPAPPPAPQVDDLQFPSMDLSIFSTLLEDLSGTEGLGDPLHPSLSQPEGLLCSEPTRTSHQAPPGPLEILGPGGYLLEDGLEDIFEDIDTSMYDSELWSPASLPNLKEGFSSSVQERPDLADLDYLMDFLVEAQEL
ncbi:hypothetical protein JRQ81_011358 [Phrynocephalus forsythii]|uniref:SERTA domain-containing protein n=1 Tax=Phrynocephalus forsythii TaxID=171643 RepID=A0A9Q0X8Y1_9SAUR|nr:hypothetical protein JRQ81_011358 [Phrynocephalus forsythii]